MKREENEVCLWLKIDLMQEENEAMNEKAILAST